MSTEGVCKTVVAIDGYNAYFYPNTRIKNEKRVIVPPERVRMTEGFIELTKTDWTNAVCVLTVDEIAIAQEDQISYLPRSSFLIYRVEIKLLIKYFFLDIYWAEQDLSFWIHSFPLK